MSPTQPRIIVSHATFDTYDSGSDGDYEYDDQDYDGDDDDLSGDVTRKSPKRRKRSASAGETNQQTPEPASPKGAMKKARKVQSCGEMQQSSAQLGDSDDEFISLIEDGNGNSPTPEVSTNPSPSRPFNAPRSRTSSKSKPKPKSKRRHHCPRPNCSATFTRITDMERHMGSVHRTKDDGEVNEACRCAFCGKMFSREDAVLRHENDSCPVRVKRRRW